MKYCWTIGSKSSGFSHPVKPKMCARPMTDSPGIFDTSSRDTVVVVALGVVAAVAVVAVVAYAVSVGTLVQYVWVDACDAGALNQMAPQLCYDSGFHPIHIRGCWVSESSTRTPIPTSTPTPAPIPAPIPTPTSTPTSAPTPSGVGAVIHDTGQHR